MFAEVISWSNHLDQRTRGRLRRFDYCVLVEAYISVRVFRVQRIYGVLSMDKDQKTGYESSEITLKVFKLWYRFE